MNPLILGEFEHLVLLAILRLHDNAYGVAIRRELTARAKRETTPGALYTTLDRLEEKGLLTSRLGESTPERGGRAKRYFTVSASGLRAIAHAQRTNQRMLSGLHIPGLANMSMARSIFAVTLLAISLCLNAQTTRLDSKQLSTHTDFKQMLKYTIDDAPLTRQERAQISGLIQSTFEKYPSNQRNEQLKVMRSAAIGLADLLHNGSQQILVRGPLLVCGGTGNCPIWVLTRTKSKATIILETWGAALVAGNASDLVAMVHLSAFETGFSVYRWNATKYEQSDCYMETRDRDQTDKPSVIHDCPTPNR